MKRCNFLPLLVFVFLSVALSAQQHGADATSAFAKAEQLFQKEQYTKAKPLFESYLKSHPSDLKTLAYLGDIAGYAKQWDIAISYYERCKTLAPSNAEYHYRYGGVLGMKALEVNKFKALSLVGDIKEAFLTAVRLDPNHIDARWALVEFYIQLPAIIGGSESKALQYANELERLSPVDGYLAKGYIAEYNDRARDAERYYKKAVDVGGSVTCYTKLYEHYEKRDMPEKALATLNEAQQKHGQHNRLHYQLGKIAGQYGIGLDQGIACLNTYIDQFSVKDGVPKDWAYLRLAQIYKHKGDKTSAKQWINKALSSRADFKEALQERKLIEAL